MVYTLALLFSMTFLAGCAGREAPQQDNTEKVTIISTIFPQYDWIRHIVGEENRDRFDLTLLISSGVDLHNYNPSVQDIARIKTSDVIVYVGGHSDDWLKDVLRDADPDIITLNLMDVLGEALGDEHMLEGFCDDDSCDDDHDHTDNHDETHADEHVWLSLRRAKIICAAIADMLSDLDADNAQEYRDNANAYIASLSALEADYQAAVDAAKIRSLVFADRFPFRYMMADYGLDHYSAFSGCSSETEASFVTVISLANRLNQIGTNVVLVTESSDQSIARTVINSSDAKNQNILVLDAVQSVTSADIQNGVTYLSIMEKNLDVLKQALS